MTCLSGSTAETCCADPRYLGRIRIKARPLSEPSLLLKTSRCLYCSFTMFPLCIYSFPARLLKHPHATASPAQCLLGKALALARFLTRPPSSMLTQLLLALLHPGSSCHASLSSMPGCVLFTVAGWRLDTFSVCRSPPFDACVMVKSQSVRLTPSILIFRHSHGGTRRGSAHTPFRPSLIPATPPAHPFTPDDLRHVCVPPIESCPAVR